MSSLSPEMLTTIITGAVALVGALSVAIVRVVNAIRDAKRDAVDAADRSAASASASADHAAAAEGHALVSESHAEKALSGAPLQ